MVYLANCPIEVINVGQGDYPGSSHRKEKWESDQKLLLQPDESQHSLILELAFGEDIQVEAHFQIRKARIECKETPKRISLYS